MTIKEFEIQLALGTLSKDDKAKMATKRTLPCAPKEILIILSKDKEWWVKFCVAGNPNTPKEILTILSKDKDSNVRWRAVRNLTTPKRV